jgi:cellobiose-specific phosphotransferase system component IIA
MKENEIDLSKIDLEKMKEKIADAPGLLPYAHTSGSALIKPEDMGKTKGRAVSAMHQQTDMQMAQLYEQMKLLADQANAIKKRVEISERIYAAKMSFEPLISHVYYLYRRPDGEDLLSLIAPTEWGRSKKSLEFVAKIKLLADHTWEILDGDA